MREINNGRRRTVTEDFGKKLKEDMELALRNIKNSWQEKSVICVAQKLKQRIIISMPRLNTNKMP